MDRKSCQETTIGPLVTRHWPHAISIVRSAGHAWLKAPGNDQLSPLLVQYMTKWSCALPTAEDGQSIGGLTSARWSDGHFYDCWCAIRQRRNGGRKDERKNSWSRKVNKNDTVKRKKYWAVSLACKHTHTWRYLLCSAVNMSRKDFLFQMLNNENSMWRVILATFHTHLLTVKDMPAQDSSHAGHLVWRKHYQLTQPIQMCVNSEHVRYAFGLEDTHTLSNLSYQRYCLSHLYAKKTFPQDTPSFLITKSLLYRWHV